MKKNDKRSEKRVKDMEKRKPEQENTEKQGTEEETGEAEAGQEKEAASEEENTPKEEGQEQKKEAEEGTAEAPEKAAETSKKDPRDAKIEELNDRVMRQMAEFDNFRKRTEKEKEQMFEVGVKSVIEKILPVVDNFERGLEAAADKTDDPFVDGMDKIYRQLMTELDNIGVKPIEALGKEFDPNFHNAVMQEESEDAESGTVIKELQKGYMYRDSVVRHSMVSVAG